VQLPLLLVPQENLSWYSVLKISRKVTHAIKCWFSNDYFYQNLLLLNQDCWSYCKRLRGSGFFETQCITMLYIGTGSMWCMTAWFIHYHRTSAGDMSLLLSPMRLASLQQLCRIAIRRLLTRDKVDSLLCMPAPIRRYLQYDRQPVSACGWLADLHIQWLDCA